MKKHKHWFTFLVAVVIIAVIVIPLIINWLFTQVAPWNFMAVEWEVSDALSYWGTVLSFGGALALGAVTVFQTKKAYDQTEKANQLAQDALIQTEKANELAAQMQKLEQARFVSMVSINDVSFEKVSVDIPGHKVAGIRTPITEKIPMYYENPDRRRWYLFDLDICNESDYPIVQICISTIIDGNDCSAFWNIPSAPKTLYLAAHKNTGIQLVFSGEELEEQEITEMTLEIDFVNIFDYKTSATLHLSDVGRKTKVRYAYRLAKFVDIRPQRNDEEF